MVNAEEQTIDGILREARARDGRTLGDIAADLRIRERYLAALESGDHEALPPPAFAAGFVRSYANLLGLDGCALARRFKEEAGCAEIDARLHFPEPLAESRLPGRTAMVSAAVGMLAIYFGWFADFTATGAGAIADVRGVEPVPARLAAPAPAQLAANEASEAASVEVADDGMAMDGLVNGTPAPARAAAGDRADLTVTGPAMTAGPEQPAATLPGRKLATAAAPHPEAAAPSQRIVLTATNDAWLRVVDAMDREIWNGVLHAGESWSPASPGLRMMTSNAGAVTLLVDGRRLGALGEGGAVVRDIRLDPDHLKSTDRRIIN